MRCVFIAVLAVLLLVGCQSNPVRVTDDAIASRDAQLAALKPWQARGSLIVNSKEQGVINATFTWDAKESGFDIRLIGPLGLNTYRITENESGARVTGDNQIFTGQSAEALLYDAIGVRVPLVNMQDWVVGLQGRATNAERDRQGRIRRMLVTGDDQARWDVNFQRYTSVEELQLPRQILVSGDDVEIRMSIRSWIRPDAVNQERLSIPTASL